MYINLFFLGARFFRDNNGAVTNLVTVVTILETNHVQLGGEIILSHTPYAPCMEYLATCTP